jgi:type IV secretory pathway TrbD component
MDKVEGYEIAFHNALAEPVTLGGVPREIAILIGTLCAMLTLGLQVPWIGLPLGAGLWTAAYALARRDPYVFDVLRRHIRQPLALEG